MTNIDTTRASEGHGSQENILISNQQAEVAVEQYNKTYQTAETSHVSLDKSFEADVKLHKNLHWKDQNVVVTSFNPINSVSPASAETNHNIPRPRSSKEKGNHQSEKHISDKENCNSENAHSVTKTHLSNKEKYRQRIKQQLHQKSNSRVSLLSLSSSHNEKEKSTAVRIAQRLSVERRPFSSHSNSSKYHIACFPKEDPALIIGSKYRRIQSAKQREVVKPQRRSIRSNSELSELNDHETIVNLVYEAHHETEQDELERARLATGREARAIRSGCLSIHSFSEDYFKFSGSSTWARKSTSSLSVHDVWQAGRSGNTRNDSPVSARNGLQRRCQSSMAARQSSSFYDYPTCREEDGSMSRFTTSRQSLITDNSDTSSNVSLTDRTLRPCSEMNTDAPEDKRSVDNIDNVDNETERTLGSSFLYQMVGFDQLSDNVPAFVQQNVKKNGRLQTETFILKLNHLRRRRVQGTVENNAALNISHPKTKANTSGITGGNASPAQGDINVPS